jgi:hypothetical protein
MATAATETDPKAVAEEHAGRTRVVPAAGVGDTLTSLDFGPVGLGQSTTRELTVGNIGTAVLSVTNISSTDPRFSVVSPAGLFTVEPNAQQLVTVRFRPTTVGPHSGELRIASTDPDAATISIQLRGVGDAPNIAVAPVVLNFGVCVGESDTQGLTVGNTGPTAALSVTNISSTNPSFSVVSPAVPFTVAPNAQQLVTVGFGPTTVGTHRGELRIASNAPDVATVTIQLSGSATRGRTCPAGQICCEFGACGGCDLCVRPRTCPSGMICCEFAECGGCDLCVRRPQQCP